MNKINPLQNTTFRETIPRKSFILKTGIVFCVFNVFVDCRFRRRRQRRDKLRVTSPIKAVRLFLMRP